VPDDAANTTASLTTNVDRAPSAGARPAADRAITAYIVPHTHWDREWYRPFQAFRARLVDVIDRVLELLETDPDYRRFTLDGQAVVLEDYLALRPECRPRIERQVRAGRLRIGPWYVLADEFLVSPEALVRNLQVGRRICRAFGPSMPVGYTPDSFGHISQLPLIARGFDLDSIVFERGVGDEGERLRGEFRWLAADGRTDIFTVHLLGTYSAAAALGHDDWQLGDRYDRDRAVAQVRAVLFGPDGEIGALPDWLWESFERLPEGIAPYATNGAVLLLNGSDHLFPEPNVPEIVAQLNDAIPDTAFVHSDIEEFLSAARRPLDALETHRGEFRGSRYQHVLSGVLSARLYLKQANHRAETLLERFAEPLATLAWLEGGAYPDHLLREAWRLLLQNHPHDSICGCSVDDVHDEMMVRFTNVSQLGREVISRAGTALAGAPSGDAVSVFNPLPYDRRAVVTHTVDLPAGRGARLGVADAAGDPVPSQTTVETVHQAGRTDRAVDRTTVCFLAALPALGVAGFRLTDAPAADRESAAPSGGPLRTAHTDAGVTIENAALRLDVGADGALTLTHLRSGARYELRLAFEDEADAGDEYDFSPLAGDAPLIVDAPAGPPELLSEGPVQASALLRYRATVPARLDPERRRRVGSTELPIDVDLTLDAAAPLLRLRVRLDNRAQDHRLRLRVASGCRAERVLADGHFDVLERPVRPPTGADWFQTPRGTNHQRRFVAVSEGERGFALLNRGLPEYEAGPGEDGALLRVTLLRCVGWLSREDLSYRPQGAGPALPTPGAQCPGRHAFELAVMPFGGAWDDSGLLEEAQAFQAEAYAFQAEPPALLAQAHTSGPAMPAVNGRPAATARSWLTLPRPLELTALKRAEERDSVILRIFNPATHRVAGALQLWDVPREAHRVNLAEVRQEALSVASSDIDLDLGPKEVTTLEIVPRERKGGTAP